MSAKLSAKIIPLPTGAVSPRLGWLSRVWPRSLRTADGSRALEREFLPAVLEIVETPPSPTGRGVMLVICGFCVLAIAWACWGELDIIASAPGRIVVNGRNKTIQPFERGVVRAIHAREGQVVKAGDRLVEMDSTDSLAERERITVALRAARFDAARFEAVLDGTALDGKAALRPPVEANPEEIALQRLLLADTLAGHRARIAGLEQQVAQKAGERATIEATREKLAAILPLVRERVEARRYLVEREVGSRLTLLTERQELISTEQELNVQKSRKVETEAGLAAATAALRQEDADFRRKVMADLLEARQKVAAFSQELVKAEQRAALEVLTAPVDGTVQQLGIATLGGVVNPAEALMVIVPSGNTVEIEAILSNKDIGFVKPGDPVEIKVDAFPFTRYGLLQGTVTDVSGDAVPLDPGPNAVGGSGGAAASVGQALAFRTRIALAETKLVVNGQPVSLTPGMTVTAEIRTGSRRMIEYLISPLLRYRQEALRER